MPPPSMLFAWGCRLPHAPPQNGTASALDTLRARHSPAGMVAKLANIYRQAAEGAIPVAAASSAGK